MNRQLISLKAGPWRAEIAPDRGANPISLTYEGWGILAPPSDVRTDPFLVGAPLLLPANRTAGGRFRFQEREYQLAVNEPDSGAHLHGSLHCQSFRVEAQSQDRVCLSFENRGEIYPFPFRVRVGYQLSAQGFLSRYTIENDSKRSMPFTFGVHTTFIEPEFFRVPLADSQEKDSLHIPTGQYLPLNEQEQSYLTGSPSKGLAISGYYRASGDTAYIGADYRYQVSGFDHWVLYNGQGNSGLLCIEPQLGGVNALNDSAHCPVLPPLSSVQLQTLLSRQPTKKLYSHNNLAEQPRF